MSTSPTSTPRPIRPAAPGLGVWLLPALGLGLALAAANVVLGNLNHDEGWYLLAALRTARGQWPYRDFLFTQGPAMPFAYGVLSPLWAPWGVLGGRVLTALLGLAASGFAAALGGRLAPPRFRVHAALTVWLLTACVPVHSYFTAIPKTYALAGFFLLGGFALLPGLPREGRSPCDCGRTKSVLPLRALFAGLLVGLAAATRISLAPALPCVVFFLWLRRAEASGRRAWLSFAAGGALALAATVGLCLLRFGDAFLFAQRYHATRASGGLVAWVALRAGFASRTLQAYPLLWTLGLGLLVSGRAWKGRDPAAHAAWATVAGVTVLHALSPFPYDDYQTPVMPLLAAVAAAGLWQGLDSAPEAAARRWASPLLGGLLGATLLMALASPLLMDWMVLRKDRFWFERKPRPDMWVLRDAGRRVRELVPEGQLLLTQDAYLAVEAGRDVPAGLEMGPFSIFPGLADAEARRHHAHTPATLAHLIQTSDAPAAATSGYSFAVACPGTDPLGDADRSMLFAALARAYDPVAEVPDFGQAHTQLTLWRRKPCPTSASSAQP